MSSDKLRIYNPEECAVFCKTKEKYGANSNMAAGFPLRVNDIDIRTSEALYQACRFPLREDVQREIISECSPMAAKMTGKPYRQDFNRPNWEMDQIKIMKWCLRVKLLQNWKKFSETLLETENLAIVELSNKGDDFWGAVFPKEAKYPKGKSKALITQPKYVISAEFPAGCLVGYNVMGRLAQELRENVKTGIDPMSNNFTVLPPLDIPDFLLYGQLIREIKRV